MASANLVPFCLLLVTTSAMAAINCTGCGRRRQLRFRQQIEAIRDYGTDAIYQRVRYRQDDTGHCASPGVTNQIVQTPHIRTDGDCPPQMTVQDGDPHQQATHCPELSAPEQQILAELETRLMTLLRSYLTWPFLFLAVNLHRVSPSIGAPAMTVETGMTTAGFRCPAPHGHGLDRRLAEAAAGHPPTEPFSTRCTL